MLNRNDEKKDEECSKLLYLVVGNKLMKDQRLIMRYSNRINSELKFLNLKIHITQY